MEILVMPILCKFVLESNYVHKQQYVSDIRGSQ